MERARLAAPRTKLISKPSAIDDFDGVSEFESRKLIQATRRIKELEHEIRQLQHGNENLIKLACDKARQKTSLEMARKYEFRLKEMEAEVQHVKRFQLKAGTESFCVECGCITTNPIVRKAKE